MILMVRAFVLATLFFVIPRADAGQPLSVLHIKVVLIDAEQKTTPVPRHALLISDNPTSAPPRRVVTTLEGTADVSLRPGNYTVESDRAVAFQGKAYQWTQMVDIVAGRDTTLELTAGNAEIEAVTSTTTPGDAAAFEADPSDLLMQWHDSVVALWTPTAHASGFVVDAEGLIATNQQVVGTATSIEVQLTPALKVAATVLVADAARDVAILRIDPRALASVRPVPLGCGSARPPLVAGQEIFTIASPLRQQKGMTPGTVSRVGVLATMSDFSLATGGTGGPIFNAGGVLVGITAEVDEKSDGRRGDSRIVRIDAVCEAVESVAKKMKDAVTSGTHLPVEPLRPFPVDALKEAAQRRVGSLSPYKTTSSDFDVAFITPVQTYAAQNPQAQPNKPSRGIRPPETEQALVRPLMDFSNWSEYVADFPPVLLIRVTPKLVESLWLKVARGAAQTQGVSLPPIKHFKSGFLRMRVLCGDAEVTPIHPFKLEQRVSETEAIYEGLYVFDPGALGPQCATVKLVLYSEKEPEKADTRVIDPAVVQQIWDDFAAYRAVK